MMALNAPGPRGFIALVSAVILSLVLLAAVTDASMESLYARESALEDAQYAQAREAALGCISAARALLTEAASFSGTITMAIGDTVCTIGPVRHQADTYLFVASSTSGAAAASIAAAVRDTDLSIISEADVLPAPP